MTEKDNVIAYIYNALHLSVLSSLNYIQYNIIYGMQS